MFRKLFLVMVCCSLFSFSIQAASPVNQFQNSLNDLSFKLEVVWDQKDQKFFKDSVEQFHNEVVSLKLSGLTNEQIFQVILDKANDEQTKNELRQYYNVVAKEKLTDSDLDFVMNLYSKSLNARGAHYNGASNVATGALSLVINVAAYVALAWAGLAFIDYMSTFYSESYTEDDDNDVVTPSVPQPTWKSYPYSFTCPGGSAKSITFDYISSSCLTAKKHLLYASMCNLSEAFMMAQNECVSSCNGQRPDCLEY